jgi:hypothetical protein
MQNYKRLEKWHILSFDYLLPEDVLAKYFKSDNIKVEITGKNNTFEVFKVSFFGGLKHATLLEKCFSYLAYRQGKRRDSSVTIVTGYGTDGLGIPGRGKRLFSSPQRPDRLWDPSSLLSKGYLGFYHRGKEERV